MIEFGSRRAHGLDAAVHAARAAYIAGCVSTSNLEAGRRFGIPVSGTMAHSWVMGFADEIDAFRQYMQIFGAHTTLLIDTYDTLTAARRIVASRACGRRRCASTAATCWRCRGRCGRSSIEGGLAATRILVSGDLDEHRIQALVRGGAPIDGFGVGTAISVGERRAGAGRRLQAGGDDGGGPGAADGEAQHRQAHLPGPQAGVACHRGRHREPRRDGARRRNRAGRAGAAVAGDAAAGCGWRRPVAAGRSAAALRARAWRNCRRRCGRSTAGRPTPCASATRWISWRARR